MTNKCCHMVYRGFFSNSSCNRKGVVERDGKFYCRQHDPVAVKQKEDERKARWKAEWDESARKKTEAERLAALQVDAVAAIRIIATGHNDPRTLAAEVLAKHGET